MLRFIRLAEITAAQAEMVAKSLNAAPLYERTTLVDFFQEVAKGNIQLYEIPTGLIALEIKVGNDIRRLNIPAIYSERYGHSIRSIIADLKRLAAEWNCSHIETCVYNPRLMKAILANGAVVESVNLLMEVGNGQQEENEDDRELDEDSRPA